MKSKYLAVAASAALALLLTGTAQAQKMSSKMTSDLFSTMDTNGDKVVSRVECMAYRNSNYKAKPGITRMGYDEQSADLFTRRDRNKDGNLSASELKQLPPKRG